MITTTRLRMLRLKYQISLDELSEVSGIPNQRISDYERGERHAPPAKQEQLARSLVLLAEMRRDASRALLEELNVHYTQLLTPMEAQSDEP